MNRCKLANHLQLSGLPIAVKQFRYIYIYNEPFKLFGFRQKNEIENKLPTTK